MPRHTPAPPVGTASPRITISPSRVLRILLGAVALITLLGIAGELSRNFAPDDRDALPRALRVLRRNFNPSAEQTVGAWFSTGSLLLASVAVGIIAAAGRATGDRFAKHWYGLAAIVLFLSFDEAAAFHEQLGDWVARVLPTGGIFLWAWVVPYTIFASAVALASIPWLRALPADTRRGVLLAGALYVGGSLVLEMIQAGITDARGRGGGPVTFLAVVEETAEMLGVAVFLHTLLRHLANHVPVHLAVTETSPEAAISDDAAEASPLSAKIAVTDPAV